MIYLFRKPTPESRELERDHNNRVLYIDNREESHYQASKFRAQVQENKNPINIEDYISDVNIVDIEISSID